MEELLTAMATENVLLRKALLQYKKAAQFEAQNTRVDMENTRVNTQNATEEAENEEMLDTEESNDEDIVNTNLLATTDITV